MRRARISHAALQLHPRHAGALTNLGNLALEDDDVAGAIEHYERAIAADAEYAVAYFNLGVAYKKTGRIAEGVRALRQAQRLEWRARKAQIQPWPLAAVSLVVIASRYWKSCGNVMRSSAVRSWMPSF